MKRSATVALIASTALVLWLSIGVTGAAAKLLYTYEGSISGDLTPGTSFGNDGPSSLAIDQDTEYLHVADPNHAVVDIFSPAGAYVGQVKGLKGNASVPTEWRPVTLAIDNSGGVDDGYIYVGDTKNDDVLIFDPTGAYVGSLTGSTTPAGSFIDPNGLTVGSDGALYVSDVGHSVIAKYVPTGGPIEDSDHTFIFADPALTGPSRIAVDPAGNLYNVTGALTQKFTPTGEFLSDIGEYYVQDVKVDESRSELITANTYFSFALTFAGAAKAEIPSGSNTIAVDETSGRVYGATTGYNGVNYYKRRDLPEAITEGASEITNVSAVTSATVERAGGPPVTGCVFEYGTDTSYGRSAPCDQPTPYEGSTTAVTAHLTELLPGAVYHYRVSPTNETGTNFGGDREFQTEEAPLIEGFSANNLQADSAQLNATINPKGNETTYRFEYGPTSELGSVTPVPDGNIGSGTTTQAVSVQLNDIKPVTYYFRVVATNVWGTVTTAIQSFDFFPPGCPNDHVRQETASNYLPDCRAYELASPADAGGTTLSGASGPWSRSATAPSRVAFTGQFGTVPGAGNPMNFAGDLYVATRSNSGWTTRYVGREGSQAMSAGGPPNTGAEGLDKAQIGVLTNPDMSRFLQWQNDTFYSSKPDTIAPYVYDDQGNYLSRLPTTYEDVPGAVEGLECSLWVGGSAPCHGQVTASEDLSHFIFSSNKFAYTLEGVTDSPGSAYDNDIDADSVTLISKMPEGDPIPQEAETDLADESIQFPAVSSDGSHILMSTQFSSGSVSRGVHLYMSVDASLNYDITEEHPVRFAGMTGNGGTVYFTSADQMTAQDQDTSVDLYMWEASDQSTTLVSVGDGGVGNDDDCSAVSSWTSKCDVQLIPANGTFAKTTEAGLAGNGSSDNTIAADNGDIYFFSPDQLDGDRGLRNYRNLYTYRNGEVMHVAILDIGGYCLPENIYQGVPCSEGPIGRIQVSPDGRHLAFLTQTRLTPYINNGSAEMYMWSPEQREIICASCIPNGSPPSAHAYGSQNGLFMTDDGRTFFSTADPLTPRDTNNIIDTYEYVNGRAQLISPGVGDATPDPGQTGLAFRIKPGLVGVSADGTDAYFATYETLVGQDRNGQELKIYDARNGGGIPFVPPPPPCPSADECHGDTSSPPANPEVGTGAQLKTDKAAAPKKGNGGKKCKKRNGKRAECKKKGKKSKSTRGRGAGTTRGVQR